MSRCTANLLGFVAAIIVISALMWVLRGFEVIVMRELYALADRLGLLTGSAAGAMQIGGRYISRPPEWVRMIVEFAAPLIAFSPAVWSALLVHHRIVRPGTLLFRHDWDRAIVRIMIGWIIYALGVMLGERYLSDALRDWIFDLAVQAGCQYVALGYVLIGEGGPFISGTWADQFNFLWFHSPYAGPRVLAFLVALMVHRGLIHRLRRRDGICPGCGYNLAGNRSGICPECGRQVS